MAFISVLVVACTDSAPILPPAPSATPRPVTLTLQGSPGAPPATPRPTLAVVTASPDDPEPAVLEILPPVCQDTIGDGYQCVGLVRNLSRENRATVVLHADLYDGGRIVESQTLALEQRLVAPNSAAPYRVLFTRDAAGPLVLSYVETFSPDTQLVALTVQDAAGAQEGPDFVVSAQVTNPHNFALRDIRAVATLYDGEQLVRYRVVDMSALEPGASAAVDLRWYGVTAGESLHYALIADAFSDGITPSP